MKNKSVTLRWIFTTIFALMAVFALSERGFFAALLFLFGGAMIVPFEALKELKDKFRINKAISTVLAVIFLFAGALAIPENKVKNTSDNDSSVSEIILDNSSTESVISSNGNENSSHESEITSSKESVGSSQTNVNSSSTTRISPSSIPNYSGSPYVVINNNIPKFSSEELKTIGYEKYSDLDSLGRVGIAIASLGKDTMPKDGEERGDISGIKPTGWIQAKYSCVNGGWLYNRCHLIGWQLSAENANNKNLITGTKYMNNEGMLPFENMVADYIDETNNHVAYRVTPIFEGNNLLANGVQLEAYSVEDNGEGIQFNVFCYNIQSGVNIDYSTGKSSSSSSNNSESSSNTNITSNNTVQSEVSNNENNSQTVYITKTGKKYHSSKNCPGLSNAKEISDSTLSEALPKGLDPCSKCY